ncbi:MAG: type II toxin-antitoxin system HicA family toxin [Candidatus Zixiibacteriota bacterium]
MTKLPQLTGRQVVKALRKVGFTLNRWHGSHAIMERWGEIISVPCHGSKAVKKGTLVGIIKDAGLTVDEFKKLI